MKFGPNWEHQLIGSHSHVSKDQVVVNASIAVLLQTHTLFWCQIAIHELGLSVPLC